MRRRIVFLAVSALFWMSAGLVSANEDPGSLPVGDLIFAEDFESGDGTAWSVVNAPGATSPEVTITTPTDGFLTNQETVSVLGTLSGAGRVQVNGVEASVSNDQFSAAVPLPSEGSNLLTATAIDIFGDTASQSITVTRDTVAPTITITSPLPDTETNGTDVTVEGTVDDTAQTVRVNGVEVPVVGLAFSASVHLAEGANVIFAEADDAAGNLGTASVAVLRDTIPPLLSISSPQDDSVMTAGTTTVTGTIFDAAAGIVNTGECTVVVNGKPAIISNGSWAAFDVPIAAGEGTLTAVATDRLGNTSNVVYSILGNSQPAATIQPISGDGQSTVSGTAIAQPLVVQVTDSAGNPISGTNVTFRVARSNGSLDGGARELTVSTDIHGEADTGWTLGSRTGAASDRVEVTADGYLGTATFCATATPAPSRRMAVAGGASQRAVAGQLAAMPLIALVTDENGNPVRDETVTFEVTVGSSLVDGLSSIDKITNDDGHAFVVLTTGSEIGVGTQRIQASVAGAPDPIVFTATSVSPMPGKMNATVSGVVMTNENTPIAGVHVLVDGTDPPIEGFSDAEGRFSLGGVTPGPILLHVDGSTGGAYPHLEFELTMLPGIDNSMDRPVYLPIIDDDGIAEANPSTDVALYRDDTPGLSLHIPAGSATFADGSKTGVVQVLRVNSDKIPMVPPDGTVPNMPISIQPATARFDPPARLRLPNTEGRLPGEVVTLSSFDHDVGQFIPVGTMRVTEDGAFLESEPGQGIVKGGWHRTPPTPATRTTTPVNQKRVIKCAWNEAGDNLKCTRCKISAAGNNPPEEYPPTIPSNEQICDCSITNLPASMPPIDTPDFDCFNFTSESQSPFVQPCDLARQNQLDELWDPADGTIKGSPDDFENALQDLVDIYKQPGDLCTRRYEATIPFNGVGINAMGTCQFPTTNNPLGLPICCPNGHWDDTNDICCLDPVVGGICN